MSGWNLSTLNIHRRDPANRRRETSHRSHSKKPSNRRDKFGPGVTRTPELRVRSRIEYNLCFGDREEAIRDMVAAERAKNATGP